MSPPDPPPPRHAAGVSLGRPFGVRLRATPTFLALGAFLLYVEYHLLPQSLNRGSAHLVGALSAGLTLGLLASIVLHELGHAVVSQALGLAVEGVTLRGFGGMTELSEQPDTPGEQAAITLAGPLVNVLLGAVAMVVALRTGDHSAPRVVAVQLAGWNGLLAGFNLLPGLPLDGGQLLRAALWRLTGDRVRALHGTALTGVTLAGISFVLAVVDLEAGGTLALLLLLVTVLLGGSGLQLLSSSRVSLRFAAVTAGGLARRAVTVDPGLPLAEALRRGAEQGADVVLLGEPGNPTAVVTEPLLEAIPENRRPWVPATSAARTLTTGMVLAAGLSGEALLAAMQAHPAAEYLVVDGPRLVGVLRTSDLAAGTARRRRPARPAGRHA